MQFGTIGVVGAGFEPVLASAGDHARGLRRAISTAPIA